MTVEDVLAAANRLSKEERLQVFIQLLESNWEAYSALVFWKAETDPSVRKVSPSTDALEEKGGLHDLLSRSPFSQLDFETESVNSPARVFDPSWKADLHPLVQSLFGVIPADNAAQASYIDYLEEKYR